MDNNEELLTDIDNLLSSNHDLNIELEINEFQSQAIGLGISAGNEFNLETPSEPNIEIIETPSEPNIEIIETPSEPNIEIIETPTEQTIEIIETPTEQTIEIIETPTEQTIEKSIGIPIVVPNDTITEIKQSNIENREDIIRMKKDINDLKSLVMELTRKIVDLEINIENLRNDNLKSIKIEDEPEIYEENLDENLDEMYEITEEEQNVETIINTSITPIIENVRKKDVLICLINNLDNSHLTWDSFQQHVLNHIGSYDISICIGADNENEFKNSQYFQNAKYKWVYHLPNDWMSIYKYIGDSEKSKGKFNYETIVEFDNAYKEKIRKYFYYWYLKHKIDELKLQNEYKYFYITNSCQLYHLDFVPIDKISQNFYLFETKGNINLSLNNILTSYEELSQISQFLETIMLSTGKSLMELKILKTNIEKLNNWYIKSINQEKLCYLHPISYTIFSCEKKLSNKEIMYMGLVRENDYYYENNVNVLKIKQQLSKKSNVWNYDTSIITPVIKKEPTLTLTNNIQKKNTKGTVVSRQTKPARVPRRR